MKPSVGIFDGIVRGLAALKRTAVALAHHDVTGLPLLSSDGQIMRI